MSVNSFKFVSPGVFVNEIDQSQLPREFEEIGPVVVGRSLKGPILRPVKVQSVLEFEQLFGKPVAGSKNVDVWREGNQIAPTYGAYAAEAYLKNAGPLTFVRLGGYQNPDASELGYAGWSTTNSLNVTQNLNGGAFGLFLAPVSGTTVSGTAQLAAIIYVDEGSVGLSGSALDNSAVDGKAGTWVKTTSTDLQAKEFKLTFKSKSNVALPSKIVNFNEDSKLFIRNVLNTSPSKVNDALSSQPEIYWLGETFENAVKSYNGEVAAIILGLAQGDKKASNFKKDAAKSESGWIFAQHKGQPVEWAASTDLTVGAPSQKLFKFHTLSEDESVQKSVKISIQDIKVPASKYLKFGSFAVVIRDIKDTDDQQIVLERFDQISLDPSSPNYISKKIGDKYTEWDYINRRFKEYGTYENMSRYVRVEVDPDVEAGITDQDLLPFGFYGPETYKTVANVSASANAAATNLSKSDGSSYLTTQFYGVVSSSGPTCTAEWTASFAFPQLPAVLTSSIEDNYITRPENIYWGMKTAVEGTKLFNKEIPEYLRTKPVGVPESVKQYSFVFSLDDISGSLNSQTGKYKEASWTPGNRASGNSVTSNMGGDELGTFLAHFNKFTLPLAGGFEGLDITEKEPFNNSAAVLDATADETTSYAINSLNVAIDAVSDPEVVEMNTLAIPGIKNTSIHKKMIAACETRGDSLAIIDLQGDYTPSTENKDAESARKPNVADAVSYVKDDLTINSSYGCAFYPWVLVKDDYSTNTVWMPPSVVALGTFATTRRFSEIWFAPAGFTRGGLSENSAGGLTVTAVSQKLNSKERDLLYETNINPIASFPAEGIVIFGQKTLQVTESALDRINVRRLMNYVKKEISRVASTVLFDPDVQVTWERFLGQVNPFLASIQARLGLTDFRVILDETTTTPELVDRNIMYAKILLKPARAIEFIALDFVVTNSGASFND